MSKIYEVLCFDCNIRRYYFVTAKEAKTFKKQWLSENHDGDNTVDIYKLDVRLTRQGIVDELNQLVTQTCLNEH